MRSVRYGCIRTRSHSPAPSGPRLSQIAFETPSRPKSCTSPRGAASASPLAAARAAPAASAASSATALRVAERVRRLQVDEVRDREQRRVELLARQRDGERRLGVDHGVPRADARRGRRGSSSASRTRSRDERRVELAGRRACARAPSPPRRRRPGARPRRTRASCASRAATGIASPCELARPALARPTARRPRRRASSTVVGQLELLGRACRAIAAWWSIMSSTSRWPETANSSPIRKRCSGGLPAPSRRIAAAAARTLPQLVVVLAGLQRDVVAEPLRLLVGVGVAADVDEQRGVVDGRALLLVEPEPLGEPQRDQALAQDVLHRLPEAEVDAERQRRDELRQPDVWPIARASASARLREAEVDLARGRVGPARGDDLAARVEVDPLWPVDVRVAEERRPSSRRTSSTRPAPGSAR